MFDAGSSLDFLTVSTSVMRRDDARSTFDPRLAADIG